MTSGRTGAVLVTGAGSGIGRALATDLSSRGTTVVATVRTAGDAPRAGPKAAHIHEIVLDLTLPADIARVAHSVQAVLGNEPLLAVVNNAGIGIGGPLEFLPLDDLRLQFEVNVFGQIALTQVLLELLRAHGHARILFVSSVGSKVSAPFFGPYAASKSAINAIADSWRRELAPWNIRVSILVVAPVATPIWAKASLALDQLQRDLPARGTELYGVALSRAARYVQTRAPASAMGVDAVVRVARRAIFSRRPHQRYLVGQETRAGIVLSAVLPARIFDAVLNKRMG